MENLLFLGVPILKHIRVSILETFGNSADPVQIPQNAGITVGEGPTALAVGTGGVISLTPKQLDIFNLIYPFSPLSPSLLETAGYRLKYFSKGR